MAACGFSQGLEYEQKIERKSVEILDEKKEEIEPEIEVVIMEKYKNNHLEKVKLNSMERAKTDGTRVVNFWGKRVPLFVAKSIFLFFDKNNSGSLSKDEWYDFLESYGMEDYVKQFGALVDVNSSGKITWPKFKNWICRTNYFVHDGSKKAATKFDVLVALCKKFESYDKDNKGYITVEEFTAVNNDWQYPTDKATFFKQVDKDGNNKITFNEYYHFFFHPYMKKFYPEEFDDTERCSNASMCKTIRSEDIRSKDFSWGFSD